MRCRAPHTVLLLTTHLLVVALAAIFIDDLTLIFGIIAGLAECTTVFILPSIFYLVASHREAKQAEGLLAKKTLKGGSQFTIFCVYLYLAAGCVYFFVSNYFNFAKMIR